MLVRVSRGEFFIGSVKIESFFFFFLYSNNWANTWVRAASANGSAEWALQVTLPFATVNGTLIDGELQRNLDRHPSPGF